MYYFAYCTLLDTNEMRRFVPEATPGEVGTISGWRVAFAAYAPERGGCHLLRDAGHEIHGLLYELTDEQMAALDAISGVGQGFYQRIEVQMTTGSGEQVPAITYIIPVPRGAFSPSADYTRPILTGARALNLPLDYIAELEATIASAQAHS